MTGTFGRLFDKKKRAARKSSVASWDTGTSCQDSLFEDPPTELQRGAPHPEPSSRSVPKTTFLDLPPELRSYIYHLTPDLVPVLFPNNSWTQHGPNWSQFGDIVWSHGAPHHPVQPAITATCRQIREETLAVFYGMNRFRISIDFVTRPQVVEWFLMMQHHLHLVRDVKIVGFPGEKYVDKMEAMLRGRGFVFAPGVLGFGGCAMGKGKKYGTRYYS